jgi:hypothetical protein
MHDILNGHITRHRTGGRLDRAGLQAMSAIMPLIAIARTASSIPRIQAGQVAQGQFRFCAS